MSVTVTGMDGQAEHWNAAYASGDRGRSWYQEHALTSMRLIGERGAASDSVLDVGGGASTLVDDLNVAGYRDVTVLDISTTSLAIAQDRLGDQSGSVTWVEADLLTWEPSRTFSIWHDRAVLHFFTNADQKGAYRNVLMKATRSGSIAVIGVFGPDGPTHCSGLPVQRYDDGSMARLLSSAFTVTSSVLHGHRTPGGAVQQFMWSRAVRE
ncbi:MAG: class I SAM-dependent methyltransferase [bacterium]|nr:class I SAM-dependent methyltransferase [bacterium]